MDVISSKQTLFLKRILPPVWIAFVAALLAMALAAIARRQPDAEPSMLIAPVAMLAVGAWLFWKFVWPLADEVADAGSFLRVRRGPVELRVPLADILNVSMSQFTNPRRVSLRLRVPGQLGDEISFIPKGTGLQFNPLARNPIAEDLIRRVDAARRGGNP